MLQFLNKRKPLLLWAGWFFLGNALLFWLIGLRYLFLVTIPPIGIIDHTGLVLTWAFVILAYIGQLTLLVFLPCAAILAILLLLPYRHLVFLLSTFCATIISTLLIIDTFVYAIYRFHLNSFILKVIINGTMGEVLQLSGTELGIVIGCITVLAVIEYGFAYWVWHKLIQPRRNRHGILISSVLGGSLLCSYIMFIFASGAQAYAMSNLTTGAEVPQDTVIANNHTLVMQAQILPLYNNILATFLPGTNLQDIETLGAGLFSQPRQANTQLQYPLHPLNCQPSTKPLNILMIGLDAWRFDMLNKSVTPNIAQYAQSAWTFNNHFSGGNATEPGLFSLFYSIPSTYWNAVVNQEQGPVLLHELLQQNYQLGIFVSAETYYPPYNRTIFKEVKNLPTSTPGAEPYQRDHYITQAAKKFLAQMNQAKQPFFSFVFYNTSHGYCTTDNYPKPFQPAIKACNRLELSNSFNPLSYLNRYKNAVHYIDSLVSEILREVTSSDLANNTVVIITGDHAEEFNDNRLNYWGHASNFTRYQLQTPLIIYWPGQAPQRFSYRTSHFDIVPTLMQQILKCKNPPSDYSVGTSLNNAAERRYLTVGSYIDFGIMEPDRITRIFPSGTMLITDLNYQPLPTAQPRVEIIKQVFDDIKKYYKQP